MKKSIHLILLVVFFIGCASNVKFIKTDESYEPSPKPEDTEILFTPNNIQRPYHVIGVIEAELGKKARRPELDYLLIKKAREIGADGVILVEYDIDRNVYMEHHHTVFGHGPWTRHVVTHHPKIEVKKSATGIAVIFE
jgi:hypothetical protein